MGLFRSKPVRTYTLEDHSRDYALCQHAPQGIAGVYAEYVVAEDAAGAFGEFGANHAHEWPAWCEQNLSACPECGSRWGLWVPCVSAWECKDCSFSWNGG